MAILIIYHVKRLDVFKNWDVSNLIDSHLDPQTVIARHVISCTQWLNSIHSVQHHHLHYHTRFTKINNDIVFSAAIVSGSVQITNSSEKHPVTKTTSNCAGGTVAVDRRRRLSIISSLVTVVIKFHFRNSHFHTLPY